MENYDSPDHQESESMALARMRTLLALERNYLAEERTFLAIFRTGLALTLIGPPFGIALFSNLFESPIGAVEIIFYAFILLIMIWGVSMAVSAHRKVKKVRTGKNIVQMREKHILDQFPAIKSLLADCMVYDMSCDEEEDALV